VSSGIGIATGFFTCAAAGILGALLLAPFDDLRRFFFALNGGLAFGFLCLAAPYRPDARLLLSGAAAPGRLPEYVGSLAAGLAIVLVIAYVAVLYLPGGRRGRALLALATSAALVATAADGWQAARGGAAGWISGANALAAAALLGSVIVAMILGHWYLVRWRLPVAHLVRFSLVMAGAIALRAALLIGGLWIAGARSPLGLGGFLSSIAVDRAVFFWPRVGFGILGPAVFAYMVHETARIRSTQSATGILYIAVIFVIIGEFMARYLTVAGVGPM
jgi:hypothetical protein